MSDPKRREKRREHLDASAVPVERALLARAGALEADPGDTGGLDDPHSRYFVAEEFRALAEELHWW